MYLNNHNSMCDLVLLLLSNSVVVSTLDWQSGDPGSIPGIGGDKLFKQAPLARNCKLQLLSCLKVSGHYFFYWQGKRNIKEYFDPISTQLNSRWESQSIAPPQSPHTPLTELGNGRKNCDIFYTTHCYQLLTQYISYSQTKGFNICTCSRLLYKLSRTPCGGK